MKRNKYISLVLAGIITILPTISFADIDQYRKETVESQKLLDNLMRKVELERTKEQVLKQNAVREALMANTQVVSQNNTGIPAQNFITDNNSPLRISIAKVALTYRGIPYLWGGTGPKSYDCSGFVQNVYRRFGYNIPRVSIDQGKYGQLIKKGNLRIGDLVFFDTRKSSQLKKDSNGNIIPTRITHVGMYIGDGKMVHASSNSGKIIVASLDESYFRTRFMHARRIVK